MSEEFRPFTVEQVQEIVGISPAILDSWLGVYVHYVRGDSGMGLDYCQTFGVFVAWRYMQEGSGEERAVAAMKYLISLGMDGILSAHRAGCTFAATSEQLRSLPRQFRGVKGMMVEPPKSKLGMALCTKSLLGEYRMRLDRMFPQRVIG